MRFQKIEHWEVEMDSIEAVQERFGPKCEIIEIGSYFRDGRVQRVYEVYAYRDIHPDGVQSPHVLPCVEEVPKCLAS